jgi:hypothetical protein
VAGAYRSYSHGAAGACRLLEEKRREKRTAVDAVALMKAGKAKGVGGNKTSLGGKTVAGGEGLGAQGGGVDVDLYKMMMDSYEAKQVGSPPI